MTLVPLSDHDMERAWDCAQRQVARARGNGWANRARLVGPDDELANAYLGFRGEIAFSHVVGLVWRCDLSAFSTGGDVGAYQVRTRRFATDQCLIVRPVDHDDAVYVLVIEEAPNWLAVVGWMRARDAKQPLWQRDPGGRGPAFFVPRSMLRPMSELPRLTREGGRDGRAEEALPAEAPRRHA